MMTHRTIRAALLLGCTLGASELALAAGQAAAGAVAQDATQASSAADATSAKGKKSGQRAGSSRASELQKQLKAVQAQLRELAEQNRALLEHQKVIDRELQEQKAQLAQQAAAEAQLNAQVQQAASSQVAGVASQPGGQRGGAQAPVVAGGPNTPAQQGALPGAQASAGAGPATEQSTSALPDSTSALPNATASNGGASSLLSFAQNVKLWGYGEVYYTDPLHDRDHAQADLARAVFGIGYSFDSRTEFNSEYEVEHAVASASDPGEFEVEQFYIDHQLNNLVTVRGGLFLMPFGMLNEHHEPTNFYGVQRNFVETLIIPSTWREGGFNLHGDTSAGFGWNAGVTTGFDLSKWSFAPEFPPYKTALELEDNDVAPLQATHQELALGNAHDLSQYVALGYSARQASRWAARSLQVRL